RFGGGPPGPARRPRCKASFKQPSRLDGSPRKASFRDATHNGASLHRAMALVDSQPAVIDLVTSSGRSTTLRKRSEVGVMQGRGLSFGIVCKVNHAWQVAEKLRKLSS